MSLSRCCSKNLFASSIETFPFKGALVDRSNLHSGVLRIRLNYHFGELLIYRGNIQNVFTRKLVTWEYCRS